MKKSLFILPLLALTAVSCDNTEDLIFDGSAAERLEQGRKDAANLLTADGGLWAMEYFANEDEPGYVMLFRFNKNGSVEISGNHKWIGNKFRKETSLWEVISDNGTIVTFNSYNPVFHVFSDPADITGEFQPVNPDRDNEPIDETGYGHEGDYEFQLMADGDADNVRFLGKKRLYNTYLRKLPADTDEQAYLDNVKAKEKSLFSSYFPTLIIESSESGKRFVASAKDGIMSVYPEDGDKVTQTREKNYIVTASGIRFSTPFEVLLADGSEMEMTSFEFTADGGLECPEYTFSLPIDNYEQLFFDRSLSWTIDFSEESCDEIVTTFDKFKTSYDAYFKSKGSKLNGVTFSYNLTADKDLTVFDVTGSIKDVSFTRQPELGADGAYKFNISLTDGSKNGLTVLSKVANSKEFLNLLNSHSYKVAYRSKLAPDVVVLTATDNPAFHFNMALK